MTIASKRAERREHLIELAVEDILDYGVNGCSFRTLAKRAGTTTAPFTYAFGSRAKMLEAIAEYTWTKLEPDTELVNGSALETLKAKAHRWTPIDEADAPFVYVYIDLGFYARHDEQLAAAMKELDVKGEAVWRELVDKAKADGELDADIDTDVMIAQIWALCDGLAVARMSHSEHFTFEMMRRTFCDGFDRIVGTTRAAAAAGCEATA